MIQVLFELIDGKLFARLPRNSAGSVREPDGQRLLSLDQAAAKTGRGVDDLRADYLATFADLLDPDDLVDGVADAVSAPDNGDPASSTSSTPATAPPPGTPTSPSASADPIPSPYAAAANFRAGRAPREIARMDLLHALHYPELSVEQFDYFLAEAEARKLDAYRRQVYPVLEHDFRTNRPVLLIVAAIEGLRLVAHRSGQYAGIDETRFEIGDDGLPVRATCTVYRMVDGQRQPFNGSAHWDEFYPPGGESLWDEKPRVCIEKCAEAAALRKAFPDECGKLYCAEELTARRERRGRGNKPVTERRPSAPGSAEQRVEYDAPEPPDIDDLLDQRSNIEVLPPGPRTAAEFERELITLGYEDESRRRRLIERLQACFPELAVRNKPAFYARAMPVARRWARQPQTAGA